MEAKSYACPTCGAAMEFDVIEQKMACSHCGTKMTVQELNRHYQQFDKEYGNPNAQEYAEEASSGNVFDNSFTGQEQPVQHERNYNGNFKVYRCAGCGAEVLTDDYTAATFCSFCGRPSLMEDRLTGALLPEYVIPFKINKEEAVSIYKSWAKKGALTPSLLRENATIEKITGMYVPFWLYDYNALIDLNAKCTITRSRTSGDYRIVDTDHYDVKRVVEAMFSKVPADASEKMPDNIMDMLEPFSYGELKTFEMPYLSGYYSERFNYDDVQMMPRIERRIAQYIEEAGRDTIDRRYSTVNIMNKNIKLNKMNASYALLPVWMLNYRYNNKDYMFALNGQTGKIVADRPLSKAKGGAWFASVFTVLFTILMLMGRFLGA